MHGAGGGGEGRAFMMSLHVSVLPAPDSPDTRMLCETPAATIWRYAASAVAYTCGERPERSWPLYISIMWWP